MNKFISLAAKTIIILSIVFICTKIGLYRHALHKQRKELFLRKDFENIPNEHSEVLDRLNELTAIPVIGSFYLEPKIQELIRLERWQEGLDLALDSLDSKFRNRSYKLWLAKAKAEFSLRRYQQCELSLTKASSFAKNWIDDKRVEILMDKLINVRALPRWKEFDEERMSSVFDIQSSKDYVKLLRKRENEAL